MKAFEYVTAQSMESAVSLCGKKGKFIAGGTDLLGELKDFIAEPDRVVNVKALPGTNEFRENDTSWTIGANVRIAELAAHPGIREALPGVAEAANHVGSPQIRNMGTVAGNLAQHSRCWYYRHRDITCLKNGGARCYARESENKYHSLFSGNPCISPVVSNLAVIFAAVEASAIVRRGDKIVIMSMDEFYRNAWFNPYAHNSLEPGELIIAVGLPKGIYQRSAYNQISEKSDFDWALVSCAAAANLDGNRIANVRVALGAISPIPHQVDEAHTYLKGKELNNDTATRAADIILADAHPQEHNGYKIPLAHTLIRRTLLQLA